MSSLRNDDGCRVRPVVVVGLGIACITCVGGLALGGCSTSASSASTPLSTVPSSMPTAASTYGGLPSYLPTSSLDPDSALVGTAGRPALTTEGDVVDVRLTGAAVRASVSGPVVPGEGLPYESPATTCTWTVTLSRPSAPVRVSAADFTTIDHLGHIYRPTFVAGQPRPRAVLAGDHSVRFELRAVMPTGEGLLRWAPAGHIVASWDFEVEND